MDVYVALVQEDPNIEKLEEVRAKSMMEDIKQLKEKA